MALKYWSDGLPVSAFDNGTGGLKYWFDGFAFAQLSSTLQLTGDGAIASVSTITGNATLGFVATGSSVSGSSASATVILAFAVSGGVVSDGSASGDATVVLADRDDFDGRSSGKRRMLAAELADEEDLMLVLHAWLNRN